MIAEIGRCVVQKISFSTHTAFERQGSPRHRMATIVDEQVSSIGIYHSAAHLNLKPGEAMAVWEIDPGEHRTFAEMANNLAPVPSHLMVRTADGKLLELNPSYIHISNRPPEYVPYTPEELADLGL